MLLSSKYFLIDIISIVTRTLLKSKLTIVFTISQWDDTSLITLTEPSPSVITVTLLFVTCIYSKVTVSSDTIELLYGISRRIIKLDFWQVGLFIFFNTRFLQ